ncbi:hypothetical protein J2805_004224 [Arthrobacter oryzae]|nr:hypothetical protein [Arthrobacter oryzae]
MRGEGNEVWQLRPLLSLNEKRRRDPSPGANCSESVPSARDTEVSRVKASCQSSNPATVRNSVLKASKPPTSRRSSTVDRVHSHTDWTRAYSF